MYVYKCGGTTFCWQERRICIYFRLHKVKRCPRKIARYRTQAKRLQGGTTRILKHANLILSLAKLIHGRYRQNWITYTECKNLIVSFKLCTPWANGDASGCLTRHSRCKTSQTSNNASAHPLPPAFSHPSVRNRIRNINTWNQHSYLPSLREKTSLRPFQNNFKHAILKPKLQYDHHISQNSNARVELPGSHPWSTTLSSTGNCSVQKQFPTKLFKSLHSNPKPVNWSHEVPAFPSDVSNHTVPYVPIAFDVGDCMVSIYNIKWSAMTLSYLVMVERYPNLEEEVGGSIPDCENSSLLDGKLVRWLIVSCALMLACRPSVYKKIIYIYISKNLPERYQNWNTTLNMYIMSLW